MADASVPGADDLSAASVASAVTAVAPRIALVAGGARIYVDRAALERQSRAAQRWGAGVEDVTFGSLTYEDIRAYVDVTTAGTPGAIKTATLEGLLHMASATVMDNPSLVKACAAHMETAVVSSTPLELATMLRLCLRHLIVEPFPKLWMALARLDAGALRTLVEKHSSGGLPPRLILDILAQRMRKATARRLKATKHTLGPKYPFKLKKWQTCRGCNVEHYRYLMTVCARCKQWICRKTLMERDCLSEIKMGCPECPETEVEAEPYAASVCPHGLKPPHNLGETAWTAPIPVAEDGRVVDEAEALLELVGAGLSSARAVGLVMLTFRRDWSRQTKRQATSALARLPIQNLLEVAPALHPKMVLAVGLAKLDKALAGVAIAVPHQKEKLPLRPANKRLKCAICKWKGARKDRKWCADCKQRLCVACGRRVCTKKLILACDICIKKEKALYRTHKIPINFDVVGDCPHGYDKLPTNLPASIVEEPPTLE